MPMKGIHDAARNLLCPSLNISVNDGGEYVARSDIDLPANICKDNYPFGSVS